MRWKIFQWVKFLFRHSSNLRKLSRQKFYNELACVFTAHDASKNADWNQQQLTDGGILANWNSANHPYCFLSNQKKSPDSGFFTCDPTKKCIMPSSRERLKGIIRRGHDLRLGTDSLSLLTNTFPSNNLQVKVSYLKFWMLFSEFKSLKMDRKVNQQKKRNGRWGALRCALVRFQQRRLSL